MCSTKHLEAFKAISVICADVMNDFYQAKAPE